MINLNIWLCFFGIHKRAWIDKSRGITGGIHCIRCGKVLMSPIKWPKPPLRNFMAELADKGAIMKDFHNGEGEDCSSNKLEEND